MNSQWPNPGQDIAHRLNKAVEKDPVAELAAELYSEGYTDGAVNKLLLGADVATENRMKLTNHLRDIKIKKGNK